MCSVSIEDTIVSALIDTGASVNVMDSNHYNRLVSRPPLAPSTAKIYSYGGTRPLPLRGVIHATVVNGAHATKTTFHNTEGGQGTLLSCHTAEDLGLVFFANQVHE